MIFLGHKPIFFLTGISAITVGVLYAIPLYGTVEAEVTYWGFAAIVAGIFSIYLSHLALRKERVLWLITSYFLLFLIQLPPIFLWFTMEALTDYPSGKFVPNEWYSLPHFLVAILSLWSMYTLILKIRTCDQVSKAAKRSPHQ